MVRLTSSQEQKNKCLLFLLAPLLHVFLMQHNGFPVREMAAGLEPPQVRQLLKYLLQVLQGITRGSLTPPCLTSEIKCWPGTGLPFIKTLVCLKGHPASTKDQGSISVSTQGTIKLCYHSAWSWITACNRVRKSNVDLQSFLLMG